jgi:hypothetical protein
MVAIVKPKPCCCLLIAATYHVSQLDVTQWQCLDPFPFSRFLFSLFYTLFMTHVCLFSRPLPSGYSSCSGILASQLAATHLSLVCSRKPRGPLDFSTAFPLCHLVKTRRTAVHVVFVSPSFNFPVHSAELLSASLHRLLLFLLSFSSRSLVNFFLVWTHLLTLSCNTSI